MEVTYHDFLKLLVLLPTDEVKLLTCCCKISYNSFESCLLMLRGLIDVVKVTGTIVKLSINVVKVVYHRIEDTKLI